MMDLWNIINDDDDENFTIIYAVRCSGNLMLNTVTSATVCSITGILTPEM